jgi:hypothetical protein
VKKILFLLIALVVSQASIANANEHETDTTCTEHGSWHELIFNGEVSHHDGKITPTGSLRFVYEGRVSLDVRAMLPYRNTFTLGVGHTFKLKKDGCLTVSPGLYIHTGEYLGASPGLFLRYSKKRWFVLHTQHMVFGFNKKSTHNYFTVTTFDYQILKKFRFDIGGELEAIVAARSQLPSHHEEDESEHHELVPTREIMFGPQFRLWVKHNVYVEATFLQNLENKFSQRAIISVALEF